MHAEHLCVHEQAAQMGDDEFEAYLEYLRSTVFTEGSTPDGLGDILKAIGQRARSARRQEDAGQDRSAQKGLQSIPKIGAYSSPLS